MFAFSVPLFPEEHWLGSSAVQADMVHNHVQSQNNKMGNESLQVLDRVVQRWCYYNHCASTVSRYRASKDDVQYVAGRFSK